MAERVVDRLEVVDVEKEDGETAGLALQRGDRLAEPVGQRDAVEQPGHRVMQRLVLERALGLDLSGHVAGDPERPDDPPAAVAQRVLRRRGPRVGAVREGLALDLADDRLAGGDDALLVLVGAERVRAAEDVEVGLADHVLEGAAAAERVEPAVADEQEAALEILEEHAFLAGREQVAHARAFHAPPQSCPQDLSHVVSCPFSRPVGPLSAGSQGN